MSRVFVAEINGRGIAAFNADSRDEAENFLEQLKNSTLLELDDADGGRLWDGKSDVFMRDPYPEERDRFELSQAKAIRSGDADEESMWVLFLIDVVDPTDDDDDFDEDDAL